MQKFLRLVYSMRSSSSEWRQGAHRMPIRYLVLHGHAGIRPIGRFVLSYGMIICTAVRRNLLLFATKNDHHISHPGLGVVAPTRQTTAARSEKKKMRNTPTPKPMTRVSPFSVKPSAAIAADDMLGYPAGIYVSRLCSEKHPSVPGCWSLTDDVNKSMRLCTSEYSPH